MWFTTALSWVRSNLWIVACTAVFLVTWNVKGAFDTLSKQEELKAQEVALNAKCQADKNITKGANDDLQKNRDELAANLAAIKLQHPTNCVPIAKPTNVLNREERPIHKNERGINSDWLLDFSANECSTYWRQLKICDKFLDDERK